MILYFWRAFVSCRGFSLKVWKVQTKWVNPSPLRSPESVRQRWEVGCRKAAMRNGRFDSFRDFNEHRFKVCQPATSSQQEALHTAVRSVLSGVVQNTQTHTHKLHTYSLFFIFFLQLVSSAANIRLIEQHLFRDSLLKQQPVSHQVFHVCVGGWEWRRP